MPTFPHVTVYTVRQIVLSSLLASVIGQSLCSCQADASSVHMSLHDSLAIVAVVTVDALANGTIICVYVMSSLWTVCSLLACN